MAYRKGDVDFHSDGYGYSERHAAVNVKDYSGYQDLVRAVEGILAENGWQVPTGHDLEDLVDAIAEDSDAWDLAARDGWEMADDEAERHFGPGYGVASEGRSGGWCVVTYNDRTTFDEDDVAGWDAIALQRWARFVRCIDAIVSDQAYRTADLYLFNVATVGPDVAGAQLEGVGL